MFLGRVVGFYYQGLGDTLPHLEGAGNSTSQNIFLLPPRSPRGLKKINFFRQTLSRFILSTSCASYSNQSELYWHNSVWYWCFFDLFILVIIVIQFSRSSVHTVILVLIVGDLPSNCLKLATSCLLLVLGVPVDSLHHNVVPVLRVDPVVVVDVVLEGMAENPPL